VFTSRHFEVKKGSPIHISYGPLEDTKIENPA